MSLIQHFTEPVIWRINVCLSLWWMALVYSTGKAAVRSLCRYREWIQTSSTALLMLSINSLRCWSLPNNDCFNWWCYCTRWSTHRNCWLAMPSMQYFFCIQYIEYNIKLTILLFFFYHNTSINWTKMWIVNNIYILIWLNVGVFATSSTSTVKVFLFIKKYSRHIYSLISVFQNMLFWKYCFSQNFLEINL